MPTKKAIKPKPRTRKPVVQNRDFIRVGRSRIEGTGVFAKRKIPKGTRIIEYLGKRVPVSKYLVELKDGKPVSMYAFRVTEGTVIDGARGGNEARFFNHSCEPNCEAYVFDDRAYLYAMRDIIRGEELTFDYKLQSAVERKVTKADKEMYKCLCGAPTCRGTMIALAKRTRKKQ